MKKVLNIDVLVEIEPITNLSHEVTESNKKI